MSNQHSEEQVVEFLILKSQSQGLKVVFIGNEYLFIFKTWPELSQEHPAKIGISKSNVPSFQSLNS